MKRRTERIELRLTPEEAKFIKEKASSFQSISQYIRMAVKEYSDIDARKKLELIKDLTDLCVKFRDELAWAGGNLNQAMKHANELAKVDLLNRDYMINSVLPAVVSAEKTVKEVKQQLIDLAKKATKLS